MPRRPAPSASILSTWTDAFGKQRRVPPATRAALVAAMQAGLEGRPGGLEPIVLGQRGDALSGGRDLVLEDGTDLGHVSRIPPDVPFGYHRLRAARGEQLLMVAPKRCVLPAGYREWAWAVQLYAARSRRSWGIGDLGDLRAIADWSRTVGAGALMVSPMGAPNPGPAPLASPYFASSRRFRDPLLIAVEAVPGADAVAGAIAPLAAEGHRLNRSPRIDRASALALKRRALELIWASAAPSGESGERLAVFRQTRGAALRAWATFATLSEDLGKDWRTWPQRYRDPGSSAVQRYAAAHEERIDFHSWLQWIADEQLAAAAKAGPRIITDLPVGFDPGGFDAWQWQDLLADGVSVGAPPDPFNLGGQDWGLPAFNPELLRRAWLEPFVGTVRAALRHAGGLRIDHVLGLFRLWWIPAGTHAPEGAYVRYPVDELLAVLAIESARSDAIIIGEDLGTVERGVRAKLAAKGVLSTRLAPFERRGPDTYPRRVLAAITNHDLPTTAGAWTGRDTDDQRAAGIEANARQTAWWRDRIARLAGLAATAPLETVITAAHRALARSPACLVSATLEDAQRVTRRPNIPGTTAEQRDNWSRALPVSIERMARDSFVAQLARAMRRAAPVSPPRAGSASRGAEGPAQRTPAGRDARRARR
jgi:4-alpha-glucanotransferase